MHRILVLSVLWFAGALAAEEPTLAGDGVGGAEPYATLVILEPAAEATLRDNGGNVPIRVTTSPRLQRHAGHRLRVALDGTLRSDSSTRARITLRNVDRGRHEIVAVIVDETQTELARSRPVTFYLHRRSLLHPNQKAKSGDKKSTSP